MLEESLSAQEQSDGSLSAEGSAKPTCGPLLVTLGDRDDVTGRPLMNK